MANVIKRCWICGGLANSSEHMIKASDLRAIFPDANNHKPFYKHPPEAPNTAVPGVKSDLIKYSKTICSDCNNARTQPHDRAWERLSQGLRSTNFTLKKGKKLPLYEIFGESAQIEMENVYRYLLKLFGCHCAEHQAPLPLTQIGCAILMNQHHPNITISFFAVPPRTNQCVAAIGDLKAIRDSNGRVVCAAYWFGIESFGVIIQYFESEHPAIYKHGWKPHDTCLSMKLN